MESGAGESLQHAEKDPLRSAAARRSRRWCSTRRFPPFEPPKDTKYIKHIKIQSKLLTEFWGRPMHLGACVLLPHGFEEHPKARYPLAIFHGHFPATIDGFRETPAGSQSQARLQQAIQDARLQQGRAGIRPSALQGLDRARFSADGDDRNPARQPVLRRFLRGELGQPRPVRRRDHLRADPRDRKAISLHRRRLGPLSLRRLDRRVGVAGGADLLSGPIQRLLGGVPRSDRFSRVHGRQLVRAQERVLRRQPVRQNASPGQPQLSGRSRHHARRHESPRAGAGNELALGRSVGHLAGRLFTHGRRRLSEADLGQSHRPDRSLGRRVSGASTTTWATSSSATGPRSARSCRAKFTSTAATWTTTTSTTPSISWKSS